MRVIAGKYRGTKLIGPPDDSVRPTSDRVRESLFSILGNIHGDDVLDLFAGTGALGIEALSRGAAHATFMDTSNESLALVRTNLERIDENVRLIAGKIPKALKKLDRTYDLIFMDPPYDTNLIQLALENISHALADDCTIVCETAKKSTVEIPEGFEITDERKYGNTRLLFVAAI